MTSTSSPQLGPDFVKELIPWMLQQFGEATAKAFRMIWDIGLGYLAEHWIAVIVGLIVIFLIALVLATLIWAILAVWPHLRWVALINIPYLLWVSFATVLQITITYLNR